MVEKAGSLQAAGTALLAAAAAAATDSEADLGGLGGGLGGGFGGGGGKAAAKEVEKTYSFLQMSAKAREARRCLFVTRDFCSEIYNFRL